MKPYFVDLIFLIFTQKRVKNSQRRGRDKGKNEGLRYYLEIRTTNGQLDYKKWLHEGHVDSTRKKYNVLVTNSPSNDIV